MKMKFHSHGNQTHFHVNEISFSYERMSTKTRFEKEAKGNSEIFDEPQSKKPVKHVTIYKDTQTNK